MLKLRNIAQPVRDLFGGRYGGEKRVFQGDHPQAVSTSRNRRGSAGVYRVPLLAHAREAADRDAREAAKDAGKQDPARGRGQQLRKLPVIDRGNQGTEGRAEAERDGVAEGHAQVAHRKAEGQSPDSPEDAE